MEDMPSAALLLLRGEVAHCHLVCAHLQDARWVLPEKSMPRDATSVMLSLQLSGDRGCGGWGSSDELRWMACHLQATALKLHPLIVVGIPSVTLYIQPPSSMHPLTSQPVKLLMVQQRGLTGVLQAPHQLCTASSACQQGLAVRAEGTGLSSAVTPACLAGGTRARSSRQGQLGQEVHGASREQLNHASGAGHRHEVWGGRQGQHLARILQQVSMTGKKGGTFHGVDGCEGLEGMGNRLLTMQCALALQCALSAASSALDEASDGPHAFTVAVPSACAHL